ncbi:hypothetical protein HHX47_DHR6000304 [Lentinula edodes]|nr:hypothetical protein HHX47_DHR6000304 [Lentinula edodes]
MQNQTRYQHHQIPQPQLQSQPPAVAPVAPVVGTPISSSAQAYFTSYSSRLRTGAMLLVQPTLFPGSTTASSGTVAGSTSFSLASSSSSTLAMTHPTRASRRSRGTVINYMEVNDEVDDTKTSTNINTKTPTHKTPNAASSSPSMFKSPPTTSQTTSNGTSSPLSPQKLSPSNSALTSGYPGKPSPSSRMRCTRNCVVTDATSLIGGF